MKTPSAPSLWDIIEKYRRYLALVIAVLLLILCFFVVNFISRNANILAATKASWLSITAILTNLAATVTAFLAVSILFFQENKQQQQALLRDAIADALNSPTHLRQQQTVLRSAVGEALNTLANLQQIPWVDLIDNAA